MQYKITFANPLTHLLQIELKWDVSDKDNETFYLPIWRPGRYEAANYSKNITNFHATSEDGNDLQWEKTTANQWKVDTANANEVVISYKYYAHTMDAGNSWYADDLIYINFINCMMYSEGSLDADCEIFIDIPEDFSVATALRKNKDHFIAKDYYTLADSPLMAAKDLDQIEYTFEGVDFNIWIYGDHDLDKNKVKSDFENFSKSQIACIGKFPEEAYHFLILTLPYKFYHGVEHAASTVICLGPENELSSNSIYTSLLGVSSHELFHAWNIIKIRPKELQPYDFARPVTFNTGYVAEGFTTYYGDLFLSRSKVFDTQAYFNELNTIFNRHFWNYGRLNESVLTSSSNLWVDGYTASAPHKKSSIYVEGAMIALCLDLKIREATNSEKSLDDVLRLLWVNHGKTNIGYAHNDIISYCESVSGVSLNSFAKDYIEGAVDKRTMLDSLLNTVGCEIEESSNEKVLTSNLGLRVIDDEQGLKVVSIAPSSPGEKLFSINDIIKAVNDSNANDVEPGINNKVLIERFGREIEITVDLETQNKVVYYPNHAIVKKSEATPTQKKAFELWCGQTF
ncbi:MAG: M61 family peptidase [Fulvivirga sp.]